MLWPRPGATDPGHLRGIGPVLALQRRSEVRSLVIFIPVVAITASLLIRAQLEHEAGAEPAHATHPQEVQSVALDGRGLPVAELRATLATHAGDQLDMAKLGVDRAALETALVDRGYLSAKVQPAQVMFDAWGGAFVTFAITEGPLFHVRSVEVVGATERDAGIVTIARGEVVRTDRLARAADAMTERLVSRGKQAAVAVKLAPDEAAAAVDVVLTTR